MQLPTARTTELIEQEANKELLVYDLKINKAYTLNETSRIVFEACDGETSFEDLKRKHRFTDDFIYLALDELNRNNLIETEYASPFAGINRREVIKRVGLATMAVLPLIAAITAPKAVHAASNQPHDLGLCEEVECPYAQDQCHDTGQCDPATGDCVEVVLADGSPCDDGDFSTSSSTCISGSCVGVCDTGLTDCMGSAPRCKDLQTDPTNCGNCGNVCTGAQSCISGACVVV